MGALLWFVVVKKLSIYWLSIIRRFQPGTEGSWLVGWFVGRKVGW